MGPASSNSSPPEPSRADLLRAADGSGGEAERFGPLHVWRYLKHDGRALTLFSRADPGEPGEPDG
jgi:hypothetical protein